MRYIDPDGRDVWEINQSGQVNWIEQSELHTMYALDRDGQRTGNSITVDDRSIFDNLAATGAASGYKASYSGGNPSELASVFLFAADNSNAEWRFSRYNTGKGDQYAIGTVHDSDLAINPEQMGFARENEIAFAHSHPGAFTSLQSEHATMGWEPIAGSSSVFRSGDSGNVANRSSVYPSYNNSYVYFPYSGNIHHVRGNQASALIRMRW